MNYTTAVFLINKKVRAISATYDEHDKAQATVFKTLDPAIKVDDYILVPTGTRHNMTVNKVVAVDVDVDLESATPMAWVIGKVDRSAYENVLGMEAQAITSIKSAEKTRKRKELADALLADNPDLQTLAIAGPAQGE